MNKLRLVILSLFLLGFQGLHKYYVSVTDIKIIESSGTIQVTTRIFIDDLELALQNIGNDESLRLSDNDSEMNTETGFKVMLDRITRSSDMDPNKLKVTLQKVVENGNLKLNHRNGQFKWEWESVLSD